MKVFRPEGEYAKLFMIFEKRVCLKKRKKERNKSMKKELIFRGVVQTKEERSCVQTCCRIAMLQNASQCID